MSDVTLEQSLRIEATACQIGTGVGSAEWRDGMRILGAKLLMAADALAARDQRIDRLTKALQRVVDCVHNPRPPNEAPFWFIKPGMLHTFKLAIDVALAALASTDAKEQPNE